MHWKKEKFKGVKMSFWKEVLGLTFMFLAILIIGWLLYMFIAMVCEYNITIGKVVIIAITAFLLSIVIVLIS